MGYSFGPKALAVALTALTRGDKAKAEAVWSRIEHEEFGSWEEAWDRIDQVLGELEGPAQQSGSE